MAKHTFYCKTCDISKSIFTNKDTVAKCSECDKEMVKKLPSLNGPADVTETVNSYTGMKWKEDQPQLVQQRKQDYFWQHEVPRLVNSGTYSLETMINNGWVTTNEKGDIVINTKPPNRR